MLDRLLEDPRIHVATISGTSAGAMNAVVMADGLDRGGREAAREALASFWRAVSDAALFSPVQRSLWDRMTSNYSLDRSPGYLFFEQLTRQFSPYELNPLNTNPLRDIVAGRVDFERVNHCAALKVFVTATNVRTGRARTFTQPDISVDTVMASACLPFLFQAVEIGGEAYWDGGYVGNPALSPLVEDPATRDLIVVQINPLVRESLPRTSEKSSIASMKSPSIRASSELRSMSSCTSSSRPRARIGTLLRHPCAPDPCARRTQDLDASSKMNAEWSYLLHLKERGRRWADRFLARHFDDLGVRSTFDLKRLFTDSFRPLPTASSTAATAAED